MKTEHHRGNYSDFWNQHGDEEMKYAGKHDPQFHPASKSHAHAQERLDGDNRPQHEVGKNAPSGTTDSRQNALPHRNQARGLLQHLWEMEEFVKTRKSIDRGE